MTLHVLQLHSHFLMTGGPGDYFGFDILAQSDFWGSIKDTRIFFGSRKKNKGIFLGCEKRTKGFLAVQVC